MFSNMLRPSRRHAHERISQQDEEEGGGGGNDAAGGDSSANNVVIDGGDDDDNNDDAGAGGGPSMVVPGGGDGGGIAASDARRLRESNSTSEGEEASRAASPAGGMSSGGSNRASSSSTGEERGEANSGFVDEDEPLARPDADIAQRFPRHGLLEDEAERELRARRQSTCTLLILFFLVRIWFEALVDKDPALMFLAVAGTVWTYRWFARRREEEDEDERRRLAAAEGAAAEGEGARGGSGADAAVDFDPDLGLMSFQAQLALAILESQRQMFENGGYGGNDRATHDGPGVTGEAKGRWETYEWGECEETTAELARSSSLTSMTNITRTGSGGSYGSVGDAVEGGNGGGEDDDNLEKPPSPSKLEKGGLLTSFDDDDEEPSCSICLCEYEKGDKVTRLPCKHVYHESCLASWTENHVRCPLCNADLMEGYEQPPDVRDQRRDEEARAFRSVALSTLGRRIRARRTGSSASRRAQRAAARASAAASMAAAEDSIV